MWSFSANRKTKGVKRSYKKLSKYFEIMSNCFNELKLNDHKNWIISDLILKQAKKFPKFNIIEFIDNEKWTYEDILSKGLKASFRLKKNGLTNGDTIVVMIDNPKVFIPIWIGCLLYTSPSPRDGSISRMPSSA